MNHQFQRIGPNGEHKTHGPLEDRNYNRPEHHPSRYDSPHVDHPSHSKLGFSPFPDRLYAVTAVFNPLRYRTRYEHYRTFEKHCHDAGVVLYTVECAFGDRPFEVTEPDDPYDIQVRTFSEIWLKENLINIGINRIATLHPNWQYVAWIDADLHFVRPDWAQETIHQLQHYSLVQMFSHAQDVDPDFKPLIAANTAGDLSLAGAYQSFMYSHVNEVKTYGANDDVYYPAAWPSKPLAYWHPGFCFAARREAIDALGGLFEVSIAGNSDHLMCNALIGNAKDALPDKISQAFRDELIEWQNRAEKHIQHNVGYVPGLVLHGWHGKKKDRQYVSRWQLLIDEHFDPRYDLKRDSFGLWQLTDRNMRLRDKLRLYFSRRNEDSIDLD